MIAPKRKTRDTLQRHARPLQPHEPAEALDGLIQRLGTGSLALLGEATHGTSEFYSLRAEITRRLITEHGYNAVAIEADWPDAYRINRYVRGLDGGPDAEAALGDFERFPRWMWRNREMARFVGWLAEHNRGLEPDRRVGVYGLDLYSLYRSMDAVIGYLDQHDPDAAALARQRYGCFEQFGEDPQRYGYATHLGLDVGCDADVLAQLVDLKQRERDLLSRDGQVQEDEFFYAEQNARLIAHSEAYYRAMFDQSSNTWNMRDQHMAETLDRLIEHLRRTVGRAKVAVWEHNSHLGDARATDFARRGDLNVGQLVRQTHGSEAHLVGFTTYGGRVAAAGDWAQPPRHMHVRDALPDSYEGVFHEVGAEGLVIDLHHPALAEALAEPRLERAIGVVYRPERERSAHYFHAVLPRQFDTVIHVDHSASVTPLDAPDDWDAALPDETYPFGV